MANSTRHRGGKNQAFVPLQVHGVIMESTNIARVTFNARGNVADPSTDAQLTNPLRCTAPQEARTPPRTSLHKSLAPPFVNQDSGAV